MMPEKRLMVANAISKVDTMGLILMVVVHTASIQDRDGAKLVFDKIYHLFPKLHLMNGRCWICWLVS